MTYRYINRETKLYIVVRDQKFISTEFGWEKGLDGQLGRLTGDRIILNSGVSPIRPLGVVPHLKYYLNSIVV
jgi:hypothetical protein